MLSVKIEDETYGSFINKIILHKFSPHEEKKTIVDNRYISLQNAMLLSPPNFVTVSKIPKSVSL